MTETYAYASGANQVTSITAGGNVRSFSYLPSGQMSTDVRDADDTYEFSYGDDGRLLLPVLNGAAVAADHYDANGQRAAKITGATSTKYVYGRNGHLLAEYDTDNTLQKEYI